MTQAAKQRGVLIVLVGPSGVGKSTISRRLEKEMDVSYIVSVTTRAKEPGEEEAGSPLAGRDGRLLTPRPYGGRLEVVLRTGFVRPAVTSRSLGRLKTQCSRALSPFVRPSTVGDGPTQLLTPGARQFLQNP